LRHWDSKLHPEKKIKSESKFIDSITDYLTVLFKTEGAEERDK